MPSSVAELDAELTAAGQFFEIELVRIRGIDTRCWKHAPRALPDVLTSAAARFGERTYLVLGDERVSHAEHAARAFSLARRLADDFGVGKGDRVAIAMRNYPEWSYAFFAVTAIGAIAVPLNAFWTGPELAFGITDSGSRVVIADGERLERLAPLAAELGDVALVGTYLADRPGHGPLPDGVLDLAPLLAGTAPRPDVAIDPEDAATIFYTSGTTGHPKGVLGTHRNICQNLVSLMFAGARSARRAVAPPAAAPAAAAAAAPAAAPSPPVMLLSVPLFHATGCHTMLVGQAFFGGTLVMMRRWDPELALDLIERERVTSFSGVPAMTWDLMGSPTLAQRDLSSLLSLGGGGAAAPPEIVKRVDALLPGRGLGTGYGMTETSSTVASIGGADYRARPWSVGAPLPICEVRLVDDDGVDVAPGEAGEIWMKGPNVVPGYWNRPVETAATFTDGWVHSGDIGRFDEEGFLQIVDRAKDIIIRGGENISSAEVEAALYEHPAVAEAAAIPVAHESLGEEVGVVVRLAPGKTVEADELRAHCRARIAAFKVPTHVFVVDEPLPRNPAGKVLKRTLRERFAP